MIYVDLVDLRYTVAAPPVALVGFRFWRTYIVILPVGPGSNAVRCAFHYVTLNCCLTGDIVVPHWPGEPHTLLFTLLTLCNEFTLFTGPHYIDLFVVDCYVVGRFVAVGFTVVGC